MNSYSASSEKAESDLSQDESTKEVRNVCSCEELPYSFLPHLAQPGSATSKQANWLDISNTVEILANYVRFSFK